jgi:hypothetical protein
MLPSLDLLENNLRELNHADLILKVGTIVEFGKAHPGLQNVPEDVPGPELINGLNVDYAASVQAARDGGKKAAEERDLKRLNLLEAVHMWGQHIIMRFKRRKDQSLLDNNGFDQKKAVSRGGRGVKGATPVPQARVKHGDSEHLIVCMKQIAGRGNFEVRHTTNPNDDDAWVDGGHHTYCNIEMAGFVPGTKYWFSTRYHGPNGTSAWSTPISIIAL